MDEEVKRPAADGDEAGEPARGRQRGIQKVGCGPFAGSGDAAGRDPPKALRPGRELVDGWQGWGRVDPARKSRRQRLHRAFNGRFGAECLNPAGS